MLKFPVAGRVKTRLGAEIGMPAAAWWFRHQVSALLRRIEDPGWLTLLAVTPDKKALTKAFPARFSRIPQGGGDLGQRMARVFRTLPPGPVCIIGADVPGLRRKHVRRAFRALGSHDAVFGPATDGGYWLTGLKRHHPPPPGLFRGVRWSGPHALKDSVASLEGTSVALVDRLADVDQASDLRPPEFPQDARIQTW